MISWLKEWVTIIICNVVFITIVEILLPNNNIKKYCKFVLGLILISTLINPVIKAFTDKDLVTEIQNKEYLINENNIKFDIKQVKETDKEKIVQVFNEKLADSSKKFLNENFEGVSFKVDVKSKMDEKDNKIEIINVNILFYDNKAIKAIENVEINKSESNSNDSEKQLLKEKIVTALCEELKISRNKIIAKESKEVKDETN